MYSRLDQVLLPAGSGRRAGQVGLEDLLVIALLGQLARETTAERLQSWRIDQGRH